MPRVLISTLAPGAKESKRVRVVALKKGERPFEHAFDWKNVRVAKNVTIRVRAVYDSSNGGFAIVVLQRGRQIFDAAGYARPEMSIELGGRLESGHYIGAFLDLEA